MKLISCDNCGIILDQDKVGFADDIYNDEGIDEALAQYNQATGDFAAYINCPVCKEKVFKQ